MSVKYGKLIINNRSTQLDRLFTYIIDDELKEVVKVGMRVLVPFGRGNKIVTALVVEIVNQNDDNFKLKKIIDVLDDKPLISADLLKLGLWMRAEYTASYIDAFQPILPPGDFKKVNSFIELVDPQYKSLEINERKILDYLNKYKIILLSKLKSDLKINNINSYLNKLENKNVISTTIDIQTTISQKTERWVKLRHNVLKPEEIDKIIDKKFHRQRTIARYIYQKGEMLLSELIQELNTSLSTLRELEKKDIISIFEKVVHRDPIKRHIALYKKHLLSSNQEDVFNKISQAIEGELNQNTFLIHGVTGSGKTEIYLQLVEKILAKGKDAIILVPEISLTPQTIDRFVGRFGNEVAILHSKLSQGERFDQWRKIKEGKVSIVVGARSAVFAPFKNLGLIIIDEEHESTYKSSQNPKYDTIEVARKRAMIEGGHLVLGTATPSVETYYKARRGDIYLLELNERINQNPMPKISLIDMRVELKKGNRTIFSEQLYQDMVETLKDKKQVILFLNRRGFSTFVTCRECGYVVKCNSCDISLTYYKNINKLRCHYCGITENIPNLCPVCKSKYIRHFGIGTERVEEYVRGLFPDYRIARMDSDTTTSKSSYEETLDKMKNHKIDILIGTQMIAKGLDFENVTLVGIIAADTSLNLPDYRSPERTFQLITQVAGRAGRGAYEGKVVLQTYNPEHYSIIHAQNQDYNSFYNSEIVLRKEFLYPPYINLVSVLVYGTNNQRVGKLSKEIYNIIGEKIYDLYGEDYIKYIIGPNPAPLEKIRNNYRWLIIIKIENKYLDYYKELIKRVCIQNEYGINMEDIKLSIDINPNSIL